MARQNRVTVACEVPVRRPSSAAEQWVTAAGSSRISSPTFRRDPASRGSSVRISAVTSVEGMWRRYQPPFGARIEYQDQFGGQSPHITHAPHVHSARIARRPGGVVY